AGTVGFQEIKIDKSITLQGSTDPSNPTIIDANGAVSGDRAFEIDSNNKGVAVTMKNLTIRNGNSSGDGGAVAIENSGVLHLIDSTVTGNQASSDGGGIANEGNASTLTLENTTVSNNTSSGVGGGIYADGSGVTTIISKGSVITGNESTTNEGGGIYT